MVRAARQSGGEWRSNLVLRYGHCTIPRHLRDIVVTEYGIADLRARTDSEVAKALLAIADSRFQPELLRQLQDAGQIERGWSLPDHARHNTPEALAQRLAGGRARGLFPSYPFGHDFTDIEVVLAEVLPKMKQVAEHTPRWRLLLKALRGGAVPSKLRPYLERMDLLSPTTLQQRVAQRLLMEQLQARGGDPAAQG